MSRGDVEFDEAWYLRRYPDVARAVQAGAIRSGYQHYTDYGKAEGRSPRPHGDVADSPRPALKPLDWPPIEVEASASPAELHAMADRVRRNFEFMGKREPHWSVMTSDRYLTENIANSEDEFFASGRHPVSELAATAARCGVRLERDMICFELGCGLGRSTIWLADMFARVVGCDISAPHLQLAESTARRFGKKNIAFFQMDRPGGILGLPPFDVFFSIIVLQHNPPPVITAYLSMILGKLNSGGVAYFQLPTYRLGYSFRVREYLAAEPSPETPEMHVVPQQFLYPIFEAAGCRAVEVREDAAAGDDGHVSQRFLLLKD